MICLDANVFLRALVTPATARDREQRHQAVALFQAVGSGQTRITATDVVLHEVLYVLTLPPTKNGYGLTPEEACDRLQALVALSGFIHPRKTILFRVFDLWRDRPELGFSDALTAALATEQHLQLLTFDSHFDVLEDVDRYRPAA